MKKIKKILLSLCFVITICIFASYFALMNHGRFVIAYESDVSSAMQTYYSQIRKYFTITGMVSYILHRNGNYQQYAKNLNCPDFDHNKIIPTVDQMDVAYNRFKADGIEIDLRQIENSNNIYISHDYIDNTYAQRKSQQKYLQHNDLQKVLRHYVKEQFFTSGKTIYFELKVQRSSLLSNNQSLQKHEQQYLNKIISIIKNNTSSFSDKNQRAIFISNIAFISFNFYAIEYMAMHLRAVGFNKYYFLAATNRPVIGRIALFHDLELNYLNDKLCNQLKNADWLTGIWFDPRGIENSVQLFDELNKTRKNKLAASLFVYNMSLEELIKHFKQQNSQTSKRLPLEAIVFEIQKFKDPDYYGSCK